MKAKIYYIHDPMCSWCWGFSTTYSKFINQLDDNIIVTRLLGGLAPDNDLPMPEDVRIMIQSAWHTIEETIPGKKFNFNFWLLNTPRRSTHIACRAVIAARQQGPQFDRLMTEAIQTAYYLDARNPSELTILLNLADKIGLNVDKFKKTINSSTTQQRLLSEIQQVRRLHVTSFPSLVLEQPESLNLISIDYNDEKPMLERVYRLLTKN
jgi:putative protein-disulfide isomerase